MNIIDFKKAECQNCYKCVRACPVKAIKVKEEQARIVESMCIGCGSCLKVCPQNAKHIASELDKVKDYLNKGYTVIVSLAPSYPAVFEEDRALKIVSALKRLGIAYVEETSAGAYIVEKRYDDYRGLKDNKTYITTSCPGIVNIITKYYHSLNGTLAPVLSPMACHGRMIKERYGKDVKVCFIGPCVAKKIEASQIDDIDAVLTFDELQEWIAEAGIDFDALSEMPFDFNGNCLRDFPVPDRKDGLCDTGSDKMNIKVTGIERCIQIFKALENGTLTNAFINISLCDESCVSAPALENENEPVCLRLNRMKSFLASNKGLRRVCDEDAEFQESFYKKGKADTVYEPFDLNQPVPSEELIKETLHRIGKYTKQDELNCGGCGYNSCREKAIAVINGMAEPYMCLPFMRQKAEAVSSLIFDITPNPIIILDINLDIVDINPSAQKLFDITKDFAKGKSIRYFMNDEDIKRVQQSSKDISVRKEILENYDAVVLKTIKYISKQNQILIILNNITELEKKEQNIRNMKINTLEIAQDVIDKQMRVAQEIASLLGETTAETKIALTQLKKIVYQEAGNNESADRGK